jgi:hypothetical protein
VNYIELTLRFLLLIVAVPLSLCLLLILLYFTVIIWNSIGFSLLGYQGIMASVEVAGIRLSNRARTINRLLRWQDIREVREVFQPPVSNLSVLLQSDESVTIYFLVDSVTNLELALEEHNILFIKH